MACGLVGLLWAASLGSAAYAQAEDAAIPEIQEAEALFQEALDAFERSDYALAQRRFRLVGEYRLNQKTTAALLMAGKALYRMEEYERAIDVLNALIDQYPETSYRDEAERLLNYAQEARRHARRDPEPIRVGIALPLVGDDAPLAQAMFNGIRLAVDEHNGIERRYAEASGGQIQQTSATANDSARMRRVVTEQTEVPDRLVRMHFRNTQGQPEGARAAVDSLVRIDDVDLIIGPLYSREAQAAAEVAEEAGIVLIAPMATEESVSAGRRYVFQTNPTITARGEIMARFALRGLLIDTVGIIAERGNSISERMADGFRQEIMRQGGAVAFDERLPDARAWAQLQEELQPDSLSRDILTRAEALYLPISGRDAGGRIRDALAGLAGLSRSSGHTFRVLGNAEWHGLALGAQASTFRATYTNDFWVDETRAPVQTFMRRYRLLTGGTPADLNVTPRRLAFTGYDVARFVLEQATAPGNRPLWSALRNASAYEGVGVTIDFQGGNVNQAMFFHRYRDNRVERIR